MKNTSLQKIEYFEILKVLETFTVTYLGKEKVFNLLPSNDIDVVKMLLQETTEAHTLIYQKGNIPMFAISDITLHIKQLRSGISLSPKFLLNVASVLKLGRELKDYFNLYKDEIKIDFSKVLNKYFNNLYLNVNIEKQIFSKILDENSIDDKASDTLYSIRRRQKQIENIIRAKLNSYLNSKYIQEPIVTIRNERFVIPVKQEFRGEVKGFIHDISASGSTVFIEPMAVFELNNELNSLKIDEQFEIDKILSNLSSLCGDITEQLENNLNLIGSLDFIFAKAQYAISIDAALPEINEEKYINLIQAKHPLIDKEKVVPIDINLGKNFSTLVITGPNTGGKTVTLKTTGLLTAMGMSGLYIPASPSSSIYVFDNIFADIGDDQSIQESLSTFSSHMTNIINILNSATCYSLILLDELGGGTDPIEGSALAISILNFLNNKSALTLATTHYTEIKNFALVNDGFENACSDFDTNTLTPTYKLLIGVPGKSNAFDISLKLGLDIDILEAARNFVTTSNVDFENLIRKLYDDKLIIEVEKSEILKKSAEIESLKKSLERDNSKLEDEASNILSNAKIEARNILLDAKETASATIKKLNTKPDIKKANEIRNDLNDKIKSFKFDNKISKNSLDFDFHSNGKSSTTVQLANKGLTNKGNKAITKTANISNEINVIGYNLDEAIWAVDKYLDDCSLSTLSTVRIVHGKGAGILRTGIQKFLKSNPHVKSYRVGSFGEGEMGVTVVELK